MILSLFFLTISLFFNCVSASGGLCPTIVPVGSYCPEGCWHESGITLIDGSRECVLVAPGYYSPQNEDHRLPCHAGSYTSVEGQATCHTCPSGLFSEFGSTYCIPCDSMYYDGDGANSIQVWEGVAYCTHVTPATAMTTTISPSPAPTISDCTTLTASSQPSYIEANQTLIVNMTSPEALSFEEDKQCIKDSMIWHGKCRQCPSKIQSIAGPIAIALILSIAITLVHHLPDNCITGLWMGLEYMQLLYLMALIPFPTTKAFQVLVSIFSIFALDMDATFSLQCMHGISQQADQALILMLPMIIGPILCMVQNIHKALPDMTSGMSVAFYLGHTKLLLTSIEAMRCSPSSWFCSEKTLVAVLGVFGLVLYGLALPLLLVQTLHRTNTESQPSTESQPRLNSCWKRRFPYQPACWQWTAFLMARRTILVTILVVPIKESYLILAFFLITLLLSEIVQRFGLPHPEDNKSSPWLQNTQVAIVFQACLLALGAFSFVFWTSKSNPSSSSLAITATFFVIVIPSILYWILALTRSYSFKEAAPVKPKPPSLPNSQNLTLSGANTRREPTSIELKDQVQLQESSSSNRESNYLQSDANEGLKRVSPTKNYVTTEDEFEEISLDEECSMSLEEDGTENTNTTISIPMGHESPAPQATSHPDCVAMVLEFWQQLDPRILAWPQSAETEKP
jgi:hypothetical protein